MNQTNGVGIQAFKVDVWSHRRGLYIAIASLFFILAIAATLLKDEFNFVVSDGRGYFVYLPSLVVDGDLDFSNQIVQHWGSDFDPALIQNRMATGLVGNKYPIGFALTIAPAFLLAHVLSELAFGAFGVEAFQPHGYSVIYQLMSVLMVMGLGFMSFVLLDRLLVERFDILPATACGAICTYWAASNFSYYFFREPIMVHVVSAFWVTASIYVLEGLHSGRLGSIFGGMVAALAVCFALISRPTNAVVLAPFVIWAGIKMFKERRLLRGGHLLWALGGLPLVVQMLAWNVLYGRSIYYSYGGEGFRWLSPQVVSILFSTKHGLFLWSPILLASIVGLFYGLGQNRRRGFFVAMAFGLVALTYVNSCWHQWWFGDAFGGRSFLELQLVFVLGLAEWMRRVSRVVVCSAVGVGLVFNYGLMALYIGHKIPRADYLFGLRF